MKVIVTSVIALDPSQKQALETALTKKYGQITLQEKIDPSLIGGVSVTIGSQQLDASVAGKLSQLKQQLK